MLSVLIPFLMKLLVFFPSIVLRLAEVFIISGVTMRLLILSDCEVSLCSHVLTRLCISTIEVLLKL